MKNRGFTLIELLVVIAIIGILSSVVLASLSSARMKARNNMRKQTLIQLRNAIEIYYTQFGEYPYPPGSSGKITFGSTPGGADGWTDNGGDWIPGLVLSGAISALPQDPLGGMSTGSICSGFHRAYYYESDGQHYKILNYCGPEGTFTAPDPFEDPYTHTPPGGPPVYPPGTSWALCSDRVTCATW
ncbi:MAG: hypothetical protein JWL80_420 [Parcubacteria group bacterium]|nr:hypothetical protein [Parcubacteria group bacterium]